MLFDPGLTRLLANLIVCLINLLKKEKALLV